VGLYLFQIGQYPHANENREFRRQTALVFSTFAHMLHTCTALLKEHKFACTVSQAYMFRVPSQE
jgi:hypothetical protein